MKYAGIIKNDLAAGNGVCVTFFVQGCHLHCKNCHNPETWDFDGGKDFTQEVLDDVIKSIYANKIQRNFCIMGGEPLCEENAFLTDLLVTQVREAYPDIKIYIWTGAKIEHLLSTGSPKVKDILSKINCLIDGPYIDEQRDITLPMRGSRNQRVIWLKS